MPYLLFAQNGSGYIISAPESRALQGGYRVTTVEPGYCSSQRFCVDAKWSISRPSHVCGVACCAEWGKGYYADLVPLIV